MPVDYLTPSLVLLVLGLALRMSLRLLYGARGPTPDDVLYLLTSILSWTLLLAPTAILIVAGANVLALILGFFFAEAIVESIVARRNAQREGVWRLLVDSAAAGRLDGRTLAIHSPRFTGIVGRWYRKLVRETEAGLPWRDVLSRNRRALPREALAYTAVTEGGRIDVRDAHELSGDRDPAYADVKQQIQQRSAYLFVIAATMAGVMTFTLLKIVPSYEDIYADFDLQLPAITLSLVRAAEALGESVGILLGIVLVLASLGLAAVGLGYLMDISILQPLTDRLLLSRHQAQVMRLLAAAIDRGRTLTETLGVLTSGWGSYPSWGVRGRLAEARRRIDAGSEWQAAFVKARLLSRDEAGVLRTAQEVGNLPWALRMLAERRMRIFAFRWTLRQHLAFTAIMLLVGLLVLWFVVAMILPLSDVVVSLSN